MLEMLHLLFLEKGKYIDGSTTYSKRILWNVLVFL